MNRAQVQPGEIYSGGLRWWMEHEPIEAVRPAGLQEHEIRAAQAEKKRQDEARGKKFRHKGGRPLVAA